MHELVRERRFPLARRAVERTALVAPCPAEYRRRQTGRATVTPARTCSHRACIPRLELSRQLRNRASAMTSSASGSTVVNHQHDERSVPQVPPYVCDFALGPAAAERFLSSAAGRSRSKGDPLRSWCRMPVTTLRHQRLYLLSEAQLNTSSTGRARDDVPGSSAVAEPSADQLANNRSRSGPRQLLPSPTQVRPAKRDDAKGGGRVRPQQLRRTSEE